MKAHTSEFKNQIAKLGREIDFKIFLHTNDKIITENGKFLMTQDNFHLVVEQFDEEEVDEIITSEDIYNATISNKGNLLSTMMKEFDFETTKDLRVGDVFDCSFGLKVNGDYEYIDYGRYMIYSREYNEDTKTYSYVAYDKMLLTMQEVPNVEELFEYNQIEILFLIEKICNVVGLDSSEINSLFEANVSLSNIYPNIRLEIKNSVFKDLQITYRDMLDQICQALGVSMIVDGNKLKLKPLNQTVVDTIDENYLKDINISFGEKYGPINSVVLSRSEDNDNIYKRDEESIALNGLHEFKIKDNLIMTQADREDYIDEIFDQLNGVEFYINDFSSTGITYLDWLDFYNVSIDGKTYKCLMLNDEIKISQGLEESVYTEMPSEAENENTTIYKTSGKTDKEVSFIVDKQNGNINAKVSKGDVINEINLDESGVSINADKISLAGKTIEMTSDNIAINSTNFQVDKNGNITANSGTFKGTLNTDNDCTVGRNLYVGQNQSSTNEYERFIKMTENTYLRRYRNTTFPQPYEILDLTSNAIQINTTSSSGSVNSNPFYSNGSNTTIRSNANYISIDTSGISMSTQPYWPSDKTLKQEIKDIDTTWIDELNIKEFEYINTPNKKQIGLIAQDYEDKEYAKYFLNKDEEGNYGIAYGNITNALIQYCQELKKEMNSLKEEIKQLKESDK